MKPLRTEKQKIIMGLIFKAAGEGRFLTIGELYERLPYECAYGSLRMSVNHLVKHSCLEKIRTGMSVTLKPTSTGTAWFR